MFHLSDLPLCLHWPHTGVIACRDLSAQFNTKKEEKNWQGKKQMVMLPPDMSAIHIHSLPVWAAREQALTAGGLALLQEFCKHRNWTPAIIVSKQYFRVYLSTEKKSINQSINQVPTSARTGRFWLHASPAGPKRPNQLPSHYVPISLFHTEKTVFWVTPCTEAIPYLWQHFHTCCPFLNLFEL